MAERGSRFQIGHLHLVATARSGKTILSSSSQAPPFHHGRSFDRVGDGRAEVIIQGVGPGLLAGDRAAIRVDVGANAKLVVRAQGATRIHPAPQGLGTTCATELHVASGATLIYLPGEVIPFAKSRYRQDTCIIARSGARIAISEILTPGRLAHGECFAWNDLDLRTRLAVDGNLLIQERQHLQPWRRPVLHAGRQHGFLFAGSLYLYGFARAPDTSLDLPNVVWGSGEIDGAIVARFLGNTTQQVALAIRLVLAAAGFTLDSTQSDGNHHAALQ